MRVQYIISIVLFVILIIMVQVRAVMLRERGIRVIVFGQTDKSDLFLIPFVLAVIYTALADTTGLPMWHILTRPFWNSTIPGWGGLVLCIAAVTGFAMSLAAFGDSFRVGIDEKKSGELVTTGMFAYSRNPIYLCFITFFIGLFIIHRNIVILVSVVVFALAIHRQILREESFMISHYGEAYKEYCKKVRRYL